MKTSFRRQIEILKKKTKWIKRRTGDVITRAHTPCCCARDSVSRNCVFWFYFYYLPRPLLWFPEPIEKVKINLSACNYAFFGRVTCPFFVFCKFSRFSTETRYSTNCASRIIAVHRDNKRPPAIKRNAIITGTRTYVHGIYGRRSPENIFRTTTVKSFTHNLFEWQL